MKKKKLILSMQRFSAREEEMQYSGIMQRNIMNWYYRMEAINYPTVCKHNKHRRHRK